MDSNNLDKHWIINKIIQEVESGAKRSSDRLKALELLGRSQALFKDQQEVNITTSIPKSIAELNAEYRALIDDKEIKTLNAMPNDTPLYNQDEKQNDEGGGEPQPNMDNEHG